jgi:uncharacterized membrane protein
MRARATLLGHPIHQMLIPIPLGAFVIAVLLDLVARFRPIPELSSTAYWNGIIGIAGGLLAAVFGLVDWTKIPKATRAKRLGLLHAGLNVVVVGLFALTTGMRFDNVDRMATSGVLAVELLAVSLLSIAGWLGGELLDRLGIGVYEDAHPDAPSSLGEVVPPRRRGPPAGGEARTAHPA